MNVLAKWFWSGKWFWAGLIATTAVVLYTLWRADQAPPEGAIHGYSLYILFFGLAFAGILLIVTISYGVRRFNWWYYRDWSS